MVDFRVKFNSYSNHLQQSIVQCMQFIQFLNKFPIEMSVVYS